jgi:putative DeoR family transcriptional regulator (stage III sporulation protein D)
MIQYWGGRKDMREYIKKRVITHALKYLNRDMTILQMSKELKLAKHTIHLDLTERLKELHPELYIKVQEKLQKNKHVGQMKGGYATQDKWINKKLKTKKEENKDG